MCYFNLINDAKPFKQVCYRSDRGRPDHMLNLINNVKLCKKVCYRSDRDGQTVLALRFNDFFYTAIIISDDCL